MKRTQFATLDAMTLYSRVVSGGNIRSLYEINAIDEIEKELRLLVLSLNKAMQAGDLLPDMINELGNTPIPEEEIFYLEGRQEWLQMTWRYIKNNRDTWLSKCLDHDNLPELVDEALDVCSRAFEQMEQLRWHAMEHNVDCAPKNAGHEISSVDELRSVLASWR
ncbi:hypothetical protein GLO31_22085 [Escherichia coli]|uniref:hypothetical protein n=1 Tax=Escherichia coli TaxID=562 RepID=UPI002AC6BAE4|nr:hypothetical protein [Escherichia coli]MDZ4980234.1 hypothetical protein [Escherichia coli]